MAGCAKLIQTVGDVTLRHFIPTCNTVCLRSNRVQRLFTRLHVHTSARSRAHTCRDMRRVVGVQGQEGEDRQEWELVLVVGGSVSLQWTESSEHVSLH